MENIVGLYEALTPELKFYWVIAIIATLVFAIQMILTFIGIGDTDVDMDFSGGTDGNTLDTGGTMQLFSVRNVVNFMLGLGWGGVCWSSVIGNPILLAAVAVATGILFVIVFIFLFKTVMKLESNGAYKIEDCVGKACDVYLRIPAERGGQGKVQVSIGGAVHEIAAVTDGEQLPSGAKVVILSLIDKHTVLVSKA